MTIDVFMRFLNKIFWLDPNIRFDDQLVYTSAMRMQPTLCPLNAGLPSQHAMKQRWSRPIKAIGPIQAKTDFEWTVYRDILIGANLEEKLKSGRFSGIECEPAELYTSTETPIGREVFHLKVTGWGGAAPPESGIKVIEECSHCKRQVFSDITNLSKLFSVEAWDGSDFFIIWPMPRYVFVTARVADWLLRSKYSGIHVEPLHMFPKSITGRYSPGHLADWFEGKKLTQIMTREKMADPNK